MPVVGGALATAVALLILNSVVLSDSQPAPPLEPKIEEPESEFQKPTAELEGHTRRLSRPTPI